MTSIILAALVEVAALGGDQGSFDKAYHRSLETGQPLVVLIGASWCPACEKMRHSVLPQVAQAGGLNRVVFTYVDLDRDRQLASRLSRAPSIPQLLRFDRTPSGWESKLLVGAKGYREVYEFVNAGLGKEAKLRGVSATTRPRDDSRKAVSGEALPADAPASKSESPSSTQQSLRDKLSVLPAGNTDVRSRRAMFVDGLFSRKGTLGCRGRASVEPDERGETVDTPASGVQETRPQEVLD